MLKNYPFEDYGLNNVDLTKPQLSPYNNSSYYISTALDYIPENNIDGAINNLYSADTNNMGSIFFHPRLDFSFIELSEENFIPTYKYIEDSPLQPLNTLKHSYMLQDTLAEFLILPFLQAQFLK